MFESWLLLNNLVVCLLLPTTPNPGRRLAMMSKEEEPKAFDGRAVMEAGEEAKGKEAPARKGSAQCALVRKALTIIVQNATTDSRGRPKIENSPLLLCTLWYFYYVDNLIMLYTWYITEKVRPSMCRFEHLWRFQNAGTDRPGRRNNAYFAVSNHF